MSTLNAKVILNVKTAAEWANSMEILLEGELGIESDTRLIKVGNGVDTFISLPYTAASDINDIEGVTVTNPTDGNVLTYSNGEWVNITPSSLPADTDLSHYDNTTSGFITASDIPALPADTDLSHYDNTTSDFATVSQIPTDVSQLNNDAGYITSASIPSVGDGTITIQKNSVNVDSFTTNQNTNKTINITVPTLLSQLSNDVGYITSATIPTVNNGSLIIRQDGNIIATFTANSATNVVANITSGGGGSGSVAWGDITGSLASQVDLSTALSQRGTLSGNNTWTGSNTFRTILPSAATDTLGNSSNYWESVFTSYITSDEGISYIFKDARFEHSRFKVGWNGASLGIFPEMSSTDGYSSYLGDSTYRWDKLYSVDGNFSGAVYANDIYANTASTVSFHNNPVPSSNSISLGNTSHRWRSGSFYCCTIGGYGIYPEVTGNQVNLGDSLHYWDHAYVANVHFSTNNIIAEDPNSTGLYIGWQNANNVGRYVRFAEDAVHPVGVSVVGMTLGTAGDKWDTVYTNNINLNGTNYNKIPVIPTGTIGASYYNLLGTNSNGSLDKSSNFYFSGDSLFLSSTVRLRAESTNIGEFYWYNTTANETAALQLSGDCIRAYSGSQAGKIDLGNPYGYWRDLYLGVGRNIFFYGGSSINDTTGNTLDFHALSQFRFYVGNSEFIYCGAGQFTPTSPSPVNLGSDGSRWNTIYYVALNPPSDIRLKENIEPLDSGLKIVNGLDIKSFTFKNSPDHIEYGIVAQDVVEKYPELISVPDSEDGTYGTYLHNFIFASLRAIQELSSKVDELNAKIKVLEGRV